MEGVSAGSRVLKSSSPFGLDSFGIAGVVFGQLSQTPTQMRSDELSPGQQQSGSAVRSGAVCSSLIGSRERAGWRISVVELLAASPSTTISEWHFHYSERRKMNVTCQGLVNCVARCMLPGRGLDIYEHNCFLWCPPSFRDRYGSYSTRV